MARYKVTFDMVVDADKKLHEQDALFKYMVSHCCPASIGPFDTSCGDFGDCLSCWIKALVKGRTKESEKFIHVERLD